MRAIVHSIHSQVPETVSKIRERLDTIVSLDSHLDVSMGGDGSIYPPGLRIIVARTGAHSALRNATEGVRGKRNYPELVVVIPEAMLARHATDVESKLPRSLRISDQEKSIASSIDFLAETMGIGVYRSPPSTLNGLVRRVEEKRWLLDVDVDYMQEMQKECYTRIINPAPGVLQSVSHVVEFIRRSRPETITISEAKVAAIQDKKSNFSAFIEELKAAGYQIEERGIFPNDREVVRAISVCREFYRKVSSKLMLDHMDEMIRGDMARFQKEEAVAAKQFFRAKGYA
jgi:hypothetical protein